MQSHPAVVRRGQTALGNFRHLRRLAMLALAVQVAAHTPAFAQYPVAPDVVLFCPPTLHHAAGDVAALWRRRTGVAVRIFAAPTPLLLEEVARQARDDVLIGEGDAAAAAATERNLIKSETLRRLWQNQLVVAALAAKVEKTGTASPSATGELASVAGGAPIAIVDPPAATAGTDGEKALQSLGLWQAIRGNSVGVVGTADAAFLLARGQVRLAIVYATDVAANPEFAVTDRLPTADYPPIVYWAALTAHSLSPNAARFIAFLGDPQARRQLHRDGLGVLP
jgi:molybdate transport system substrate-binding protein